MDPKKEYYAKAADTIIKNLKLRRMEGYYCATAAEAHDLVMSLIPAESKVSFGGSVTLAEAGILDTLRARTDIMNGYFCGHISYYDALAQIENVEKGRLLEEDILSMREFFQTDIEEVTEYSITDIEITSADEDLVCAVVTIDWQVSGTAGVEIIEGIYSVIMEKDEKNYKLVQFF